MSGKLGLTVQITRRTGQSLTACWIRFPNPQWIVSPMTTLSGIKICVTLPCLIKCLQMLYWFLNTAAVLLQCCPCWGRWVELQWSSMPWSSAFWLSVYLAQLAASSSPSTTASVTPMRPTWAPWACTPAVQPVVRLQPSTTAPSGVLEMPDGV